MLGTIGAFESGWTLGRWWLGLGVVLLATALLTALVAAGLRSPLPPLVLGAGWLLAVGWLSFGRAEGDVVVPGSARGYAFLLGGLLAFLPGGWLGLRLRARDAGGWGAASHEGTAGFTPADQRPIAGE